MTTPSDNLLSAVDRFSRRLSFVSSLIDGIVGRIAPKATAQASCPPPGTYTCGYACGSCCSNCGGDYRSYIYAIYSGSVYCTQPLYECFYSCDYC